MSKISELSNGGALLSTDDLIVVRSGGNVRAQLSSLNGIAIGSSTPAAGSFTTLSTTGNISSTADIVLTKTGTNDAGIKLATAGANRYLASDENGVVAIGTGTTLMGGTKYLTIDSGNVTVSGDITGTGDTKFLATGDIGIGPRQGSATNGAVYIGGNTDNPFVSPVAIFSGDGKVGIGTSSPQAKLHSYTSGTGAIPTGQFNQTADDNTALTLINANNSATYSAIKLETRETQAAGWMIANEFQSAFNGDLVFRGRDGGTSSAEVLRLKSDGSVGIGATPSHPLHITKEIGGYQAYFNNDNGSAQGLKVRIKANDSGNFNILDLVSASTGSDVSVMTVRDDGHVAIGIAGASRGPLHVHQPTSNTDSSIHLTSAVTGSNSGDGFTISVSPDGAGDTSVSLIQRQNAAMRFYTHATERMRIHSSGAVTQPYQPAFHARTGSSNTSMPVNSGHDMINSVELFDQGGDYNTSTYEFTAPVTGKYQLNAFIRWNNLDRDASYYIVYIITSNRDYYTIIDPDAFDIDPEYYHMAFSVLADMDANDTSKIHLYQAGGAQVTTYDGGAGSNGFSGYLVA